MKEGDEHSRYISLEAIGLTMRGIGLPEKHKLSQGVAAVNFGLALIRKITTFACIKGDFNQPGDCSTLAMKA
jgi:hypothetical protein